MAKQDAIDKAQRAVDLVRESTRVIDVLRREEPFTVEVILEDRNGSSHLVISGDMGAQILKAWGDDNG